MEALMHINLLMRWIRDRVGVRLHVEQARCLFLRKRGIGVEPDEEAKPLTKSHLGFLAGRSSDYAMDYLAGHRPSEAVWKTMTEYVQTVARMIADREGKSRAPAAMRLMIPDCDAGRERELIA